MSEPNLRAALPDLRGAARVPGLHGRADVWRDPQGVPHVRAGSLHDAFLAQGFVHAQDRLWHMEYDRRRACGRWAEYAGPTALDTDVQMRRFRLEASARADYAAIAPRTREMLDAYAAGVNAFIETTRALPAEFEVLGAARPEPWRPWDSLAVYKIRHVLMGVCDLADWERSGWVVPLGASGHPGSPHYADQAGAWAEVRLLPMRYGWERITRDAESHQELRPASGP